MIGHPPKCGHALKSLCGLLNGRVMGGGCGPEDGRDLDGGRGLFRRLA